MHKSQPSIAKNPLVQAIAAEYARQIKTLREEQEAEIENLYCEFRRNYQCLKQIIEDREGCDADSLDSSSITARL